MDQPLPASGSPRNDQPGASAAPPTRIEENERRLSFKSGARVFGWVITLGFLYVAWPLILPMAMGAVFAVLFMPVLKRLERRRVSTGLGSILLTLGVALLVLLPISAILVTLARLGIEQLQLLRAAAPASGASGDDLWTNLMSSPRLVALLDRVTEFIPVPKEQLMNSGREVVAGIGTWLAEILGGLVSALPGLAMALVVIVISLYFFLVDGRKLLEFVRKASVLNPEQTERILTTGAVVCRSVVLASLVSGAAQSSVELLACIVTGVPNAGLIAVLVFLGSFVPLIGSAPVTLFVAAQQLFLGRTGVAIALFVAAAIVSTIDNLIRPMFLKGAANLHPLLAFIAAFGGLQTLGFLGIFLGPIVAALFVTMMQLLAKKEAR